MKAIIEFSVGVLKMEIPRHIVVGVTDATIASVFSLKGREISRKDARGAGQRVTIDDVSVCSDDTAHYEISTSPECRFTSITELVERLFLEIH